MSIQSEIKRLESLKYRLYIGFDSDADNPCEDDGSWKLHVFMPRYPRYADPNKFFTENGRLKVAIANKMRVGLAFFVDYSEHGTCRYDLSGEGYQDQWDTSRHAGLLIWEEPVSNIGAKTIEDRKKDARGFVEQYTAWANGRCFWAKVEDANGEDIDQASVIGDEYLLEIIHEVLPEDATAENTQVTGEAGYVVDADDIFNKTPA
jgi:hypothetical protein